MNSKGLWKRALTITGYGYFVTQIEVDRANNPQNYIDEADTANSRLDVHNNTPNVDFPIILKKPLEKKWIKSIDVLKMGKSSKPCPICIKQFNMGEVVNVLPCKHLFHKACLDPWWEKQYTCPLCRLDIPKYFEEHPPQPKEKNKDRYESELAGDLHSKIPFGKVPFSHHKDEPNKKDNIKNDFMPPRGTNPYLTNGPISQGEKPSIIKVDKRGGNPYLTDEPITQVKKPPIAKLEKKTEEIKPSRATKKSVDKKPASRGSSRQRDKRSSDKK